jgi:hypothetical protein
VWRIFFCFNLGRVINHMLFFYSSFKKHMIDKEIKDKKKRKERGIEH